MSDAGDAKGRRWRLRFGLRALLILTLVMAAYLAGRESRHLTGLFSPRLDGTWQMTLPAGFQRDVTITPLGEERFLLNADGVLSGIYQRSGDQLAILRPEDDRMRGLIWAWDGEKFTLVVEPADQPTGASYLGATLRQVDSQQESASAEQRAAGRD